MTKGGPGIATDLVSYFIYRSAFFSLDIGRASALSVGLLVDGAIVVVEYADRKLNEGLSVKKAIYTTKAATGAIKPIIVPLTN